MNNDYLTELKDELVTKENKLLKLNCILDKLSIVENEELYAEENNFIEDNRIEPIQDDKNDVSYIFEEHIYEVLTSYYPSGLNILEKKLKSWKIKLKKRRKY